MELTAGQLFLIGLIASVIVQAIKLAIKKYGWQPSRLVITLVAFVVSIGLAVWWLQPVAPPADDPMAYAMALLNAAALVLGSATVIYNVLLKNILGAIQTRVSVRLL